MSVSFVFCVESGDLEGMTLRAVESLRRWGGSLAKSPVFAVQPRFGPPLDRQTLRQFADLDVQHLKIRFGSGYQWYHFLNKPIAVAAADQVATTDLLAWMDSDVLFVGEPDDYLLDSQHDIAAYAANGWAATTGPDDPNEPFWLAACKAVGINIDDLPFVQTEEDNKRVRLYWNAGIFCYRRSTGYAQVYRDYCLRLLDAKFAHKTKKLFYVEQVAMALAGAKLRWRKLPRSHNFTMEAWSQRQFCGEELREARVIHYHDFFADKNWPRFVEILQTARPDVAKFIQQGGLLSEGGAPWKRWTRSGLRSARRMKQQIHLARCHFT